MEEEEVVEKNPFSPNESFKRQVSHHSSIKQEVKFEEKIKEAREEKKEEEVK